MNFFFQYETYVPLNYAIGLVYKHWIYLSTLKPIMKGVQLGVVAAYHLQNWVNTPYFTSNTAPASSFFVSEGSLILDWYQ
ncbi:MAG: hypothetical protein KA715_07805 [Xanthomonadaceae bacterium]|nr:hypothetical protein [Xanthomonadaceae bacterium]